MSRRRRNRLNPGLALPPPPATPRRCAGGCGGIRPRAVALCCNCREVLAHVCYGKYRWGYNEAGQVAVVMGHDVYRCPVCVSYHTGRSSPGGERVRAQAALIVLHTARFDGPYLDTLITRFSRAAGADRERWRAYHPTGYTPAPLPAPPALEEAS